MTREERLRLPLRAERGADGARSPRRPAPRRAKGGHLSPCEYFNRLVELALASILALALAACGGDAAGLTVIGTGFVGVAADSAGAGYYHWAPGFSGVFAPPPCAETVQIGHCFVPHACPAPTRPALPGEADIGAHNALDPGQITVGGVPLPPIGDGYFYTDIDPPFSTGEPIPFSVLGSAEVPAHEGEFVIPTPVTVSEPNLAATIVIDRTQPLLVRWTPTDIGEVTAAIAHDEEYDAKVSCSAPASAGELVIPVRVLEYLPDRIASEGEPVTFYIGQSARVELRPPEWTVHISVQGPDLSAPADVN